MNITQCLAAAAAIALGSSFAGAGTTTTQFQSNAATSLTHKGSFSGSMAYDNVTHVLKLIVKNNSSEGWLTGMAFNVHGNAVASYLDGDNKNTRKDEDAFDNARNKKGIVKAKPFGNYEAGAGINGKLDGNKGKKGGVAAGASREFDFILSGADASSLIASDFLTDPAGKSLVMSFGGFSKKKKFDKVAASVLSSITNDAVTPGNTTEPSSNTTEPSSDTTVPSSNTTTTTADSIVPGPDGSANRLLNVVNQGDEIVIVDPPVNEIPGPGPNAIPLPPAAYSGLATMGAMCLPGLRRKLRRLLA